MPLHDPATRRHQARRFEAQTAQRRCRLADENPVVGPRRTRDVPKPFDRVHFGHASGAALPSHPVATNPPADLVLSPLGGDARPFEEWLTTFHFASVVLDPYTNESSWILPTAARILRNFRGAAVRVNFVVTCGPDEARSYLGPLADEFLVFADPDRAVVKGLGLGSLPAFVFVRIDGTIAAVAEGWDPVTWRHVSEAIAAATSWSRPLIPDASDPSAFSGTPSLG
jgi:hypothetical protein